MNKKIFLIIVSATCVILATVFLSSKYSRVQAPNVSPTPVAAKQSATIIVDYGENNTLSRSLEINENTTAFSILSDIAEKEKIPLETQQYDFGIFVKSINGKESSANVAWIYHVNGESGQIAADQMKINAGDTVEWRYTKPD